MNLRDIGHGGYPHGIAMVSLTYRLGKKAFLRLNRDAVALIPYALRGRG
jgi:hypothetical protein